MEYTVTEIHLPSATGCNHIHVHLIDENGETHNMPYHMTDFSGEKTIQNDPIYDFLYSKVQELRLRKRSDIKTSLTGIKINK